MRLLLDCDPGLDDALALLLAAGDPALDPVGITAVGGNVGLPRTLRNALDLRAHLGLHHVPVAAGADRPLARAVIDAVEVHGESGLGPVVLPESELPASDRSAVDLIVDTLRADPGGVHLVATGPLTNIALALRREPRIAEWAASFVMMGGSSTRGNVTPAAEFNVHADPEAAAEVFAAGWDVVMVGLDLTLQAVATPSVLERMARLGPIGVEFAVPLASHYRSTAEPFDAGQAVHDVCAVAYLSRPDLFGSRRARVKVETTGELTAGMTVVDFDASGTNAVVPLTLDAPGFWDHVLASWGRVAQSRG